MEYLSLLCHLFIIGLSVVLPLYTGGTYWKLGDTKYVLFRNIALFCVGIWLAFSLFDIIRRRKVKLSAMDVWMLCYGAAVGSSTLFSHYRDTAWFGYNEWYMGALTQLLLVGIYFFVSRSYDDRKFSLFLGEAGIFIVMAIGFCHRLGFDPTGLMAGYGAGDWEYSHMLSTIGNINWFCGYCSVALVFPLSGYLKSEDKREWLPAYAVSVMCLTLLMVQGSDTGILVAAVCLFMCLILGVNDGKLLKRTIALGTGMCFLLQIYGLLVWRLGDSAMEAIPVDGFCRTFARWRGWWLLGLAGLGLCVWIGRLLSRGRQQTVKRVSIAALTSVAIVGVAGILFFAFRGSFEGGWGNGRGALWSLALQGFWQNGPLQKLFGVGPDCFAEYVYSVFLPEKMPELGGRWAGTIFANAHNEWLNHLLNLGIVGTGCYLGIFVTGLKRYRKYLPGLLALLLYGVVSATGFQQVLSTPYLFLTLGIAESVRRKEVSV